MLVLVPAAGRPRHRGNMGASAQAGHAGASAQRPSAQARGHGRAPGAHPDALAQAQAALGRNDFAAAVQTLRRFLAGHPPAPARAQGQLFLGYAEAALGHPHRAAAAYQAGLKAAPKHFAAQLNLGVLLLQLHQPQPALAPLRAAAALQPKNAKSWFELGRARQALGQSAAAIAAYEKSAALDPGSGAAAYNAGVLLLQAGDNAAAARELAAAASQQPKNPPVQLALADAYARLRQWPRAEAALRAYLALRPDDAAAQRRLAAMLVRQHHSAAARRQLAAELQRDPGDDTARQELAELQMEARHYAAAADNFARLAHARPASPRRQFQWGHALLLAGQEAQAAPPLGAAVRLAPKMAPAWRDLGFAEYRTKQYPAALDALNRYAALAGAGGPVEFLRAICWDHLHHYHRAIQQYEAFLAADHGRHYNEDFKARHRLITLRLIVQGH